MPQYQVYFDTLEGERKYNVDIGDDEPLEQVLRDILGELAEKGHMMKGLSTGDLKVVWGGVEGRELDLARTLPEQGVHPNDVLRVLVEIYEGGGSLREDRIEREWRLLGRLAALNPKQLEVVERTASPSAEVFHLRLLESPGVAGISGAGGTLTRFQHRIRLEFTRFYPEVPVECYASDPLYHPNVRPETGFVCLWEEANPRDTAIQAIARAQAMAAYRMVNMHSAHVMNRAAADWYREVAVPRKLVPLTWQELQLYQVEEGRMVWLEPGRQLSSRGAARLR